MTSKIVIVGAGPAGIRAAETLEAHGNDVTLVHEGPSGGGNIYRRQPPNFRRSPDELYGSEAAKASALHAAYDRLCGQITVRAETTIFNVQAQQLLLLSPEGVESLPYDRLIIATGAMDRILPLPGWTLPGVYTLGGSQIALKHQACAIGQRTVFFGTGPLLYLVAYQYAKAGAGVEGVYDTSSWRQKAGQTLGLLNHGDLLRRGVVYRQYLKKAGVPIREGITPIEIIGTESVSGFRYRNSNAASETVACDAIGFGYGLRPESQIAELLGAKLVFDHGQRVWQIAHDGEGRIGSNVYVAGDGSEIGGADVAELTGELAGLSVLKDIGLAVPTGRAATIRKQLTRMARFRIALNRAFPVPVDQLASVPDNTILCRCENISFGEARAAIDRYAPTNVNQLKAYCRPGMGRCQGRVCGLAAAELLAGRMNLPIESVGNLRGQAPIKPVTYTSVAKCAELKIAEAIVSVFGENI